MNDYIVEARISTVITAEDEESAIDRMRDKIANDYGKWDFAYETILVPPPSDN